MTVYGTVERMGAAAYLPDSRYCPGLMTGEVTTRNLYSLLNSCGKETVT